MDSESLLATMASSSRPEEAAAAAPPWSRLEGRVVLVTGASSGLGREFCLDLARAGCLVVAARRRPPPLALRRDQRLRPPGFGGGGRRRARRRLRWARLGGRRAERLGRLRPHRRPHQQRWPSRYNLICSIK